MMFQDLVWVRDNESKNGILENLKNIFTKR